MYNTSDAIKPANLEGALAAPRPPRIPMSTKPRRTFVAVSGTRLTLSNGWPIDGRPMPSMDMIGDDNASSLDIYYRHYTVLDNCAHGADGSVWLMDGFPKSAHECIAHLRDTLTSREFELAVVRIELYAQWRHIDGMEQIKAIYDKLLTPVEGERVQ
jgi:hypothetical protein